MSVEGLEERANHQRSRSVSSSRTSKHKLVVGDQLMVYDTTNNLEAAEVAEI